MEFVIWMVYITIFAAIHLLVGMIPVSDPMWVSVLSSSSQAFIFILTIYIFRSYLCKADSLRSFSRKELKYCMWAVVIGVGICLGHRILFFLFFDFVVHSLEDIGEVVISRQTAFAGTFLGLLYGGLIMPVIEEIFFRGVIFHTARQKRGNLYAVLISSFLFAIGHFNGVQFISGIFMGLIIGYAIVLTGNVYIGVVIHVANNSFSYLNIHVLNKLWNLEEEFIMAPIWLGILLLVFGILMLRRETRKVT